MNQGSEVGHMHVFKTASYSPTSSFSDYMMQYVKKSIKYIT